MITRWTSSEKMHTVFAQRGFFFTRGTTPLTTFISTILGRHGTLFDLYEHG